MEDTRIAEVRELMDRAELLAKSEQGIRLVVLVKTAGGAFCHRLIADPVDFTQPKALVEELKARGDTRVCYLLNLWTDGLCPDAPSFVLRAGLMELDPANGDALVPVMGECDGKPAYMLKPLSSFC